jgi:2-dehydro-3-deoxyphosphogluconate aldolase / (4S)-4-hydroxy-2-oxoglutarate aldolase
MSAVTASRRAAVVAQVEALGVVAVIRLKEPAKLRALIDAIAEGGVRALEVTMTVPGAVGLIRELAPALPDGFLVGAGTVTDAATARAVIDAGASFVVSPVYKPAIVAACHERDVAAMPGCFSPTEILAAYESGADIVKLFPATALGPQFIRDIRGPLPQVRLMPTGGVTLANAGDWIRAGAVAVGIGSALVDARAVEENRWDAIIANARLLVANVAGARQ